MSLTTQAWRQRSRWWVPALGFLLLNIVTFSVYQFFFAGVAQGRLQRLEGRRAELEKVVEERREIGDLLTKAKTNRINIEIFYRDALATERQRLTKVIAEVKDLSRRAGLAPTSISYPEEEVEDFGLMKRSIVFGVDGTYVGLRKFINFLELSDTFLTLESIEPSDSKGPGGSSGLRIQLKIATFFVAGPRKGRNV